MNSKRATLIATTTLNNAWRMGEARRYRLSPPLTSKHGEIAEIVVSAIAFAKEVCALPETMAFPVIGDALVLEPLAVAAIGTYDHEAVLNELGYRADA